MKLKKEELRIRPQAMEEQCLDLHFKIVLKDWHMDPTVLKEISEDFEKKKCFCCSTDILKKRKILFCCDKLEGVSWHERTFGVRKMVFLLS